MRTKGRVSRYRLTSRRSDADSCDKTTQCGKNGRAGERGGTPPPARLLRASTAALPGSAGSSFVPSGEPAPFQPTPQSLETEDLSRKTGTPALAQRVLVLREKTLNRQQGPNGVWRGHLPSGTSVRNDARYPLPPKHPGPGRKSHGFWPCVVHATPLGPGCMLRSMRDARAPPAWQLACAWRGLRLKSRLRRRHARALPYYSSSHRAII